MPPAFGLNQRRYWRHFGTSRLDWLVHRALRASLPHVEFTEADYLAHGGGDVTQALERFVASQGLRERSALLLTTQGMWGGMAHIEAARDFALSTLYRSRFAARNLVAVRQRLNLSRAVVGIHVRMGDFGEAMPPEGYRGRFNVALPAHWFRDVALSIHEQSHGSVQFLVVSDAPVRTLEELFAGLNCVFTGDIPDSDCSDLLALAHCDMLVCSVSSFSVWAAFLSEAPYLWYAPNLTPHESGWGSIWGHEMAQQAPGSPTKVALQEVLGVPRGNGTGNENGPLPTRAWAVPARADVPAAAVLACQERVARRATDLVRYGVAVLT